MENNRPDDQQQPPDESYEQDLGVSAFIANGTTAQRKMLTYLGELRVGDRVPVMKLVADLRMVYGTASMQLNELVRMRYVDARLVSGVVYVRLSDSLDPKTVLQLTGDWDPSFGSHPYDNTTATQRRRGRYMHIG